MPWLVPSLVANLAGSIVLGLVYYYLYTQDRHHYLGIWAVGWGFYGLRFVAELATIFSQPSWLLTSASNIHALVSGLFLVWGTYVFLERTLPKWWLVAMGGGIIWVVVAVYTNLSFALLTIPTFYLLAVIYIWTGIEVTRMRGVQGIGSKVTGAAFVIWGIHKLDYPFLRPIDWFAPWGYLAAALLELIIAFGFLLIYFQKVRQDLNESETRFRLLFEGAPLAYQSLSEEGKIIEINQAWLDELGYNPEESIGHWLGDFLVPESREGFKEFFPVFLKTGEVRGVEFEVVHKDGSRLWMAIDGKVGHDPKTKSTRAHCILRNITERKRAEGALQKKTYQQARLIETARHLTESLDLKQVLWEIGNGARQILESYGCTIYLLEPDGKTLTPVVAIEPPYEEEILSTPLDVEASFTGQAVKAKRGMVFNDAVSNTAGTQIPGTPIEMEERVIVAPFVVEERVVGAMCLNRLGNFFTEEDLALAETFATFASTTLKNAQAHSDLQHQVIERIQAEEELRESEARLRQLIEQMPYPVEILSPEGTVRMVNQAFLNQFQILFPDHIVEKYDLFQDMHTVETLELRKTMARVLKGEAVFVPEITLPLPQGQKNDVLYSSSTTAPSVVEAQKNSNSKPGQMILEASVFPVFRENGDIWQIVAIWNDITQRKQHEREQEAIIEVAADLRSTLNQRTMFPIILNHLLDLLEAEGAALGIRHPATGETIIELAVGNAAERTGAHIPPGQGISGYVIESGKPYVNNQARSDTRIAALDRGDTPQAMAAVPLIIKDKPIGVLIIGREKEFCEADIRLLTAIGEIAASGIQRASLYEETQRRVQRLDALHKIDLAISASLDLNITLNILLDQVTSQLGVEAVDILEYEPSTQRLKWRVGRGFLAEALSQTNLRLGEGYAGRAALERRLVQIHNLNDPRSEFSRPQAIAGEGFVTYFAVPLIAKGEIKGVLEIYHRRLLYPDSEWLNFLEMLSGQAAIAIDSAKLFNNLQRSNAELILAYDSTLEGWSRALDLRDKETEGHTQRVAEMTLSLARSMGMSEEELVHVRRGAMLHDIGKMGIPDRILLKPGSLTKEEWEIMRKHPLYAHDMLFPIPYLRPALEIPYCHHEKWDGTGYPRGLKGEQIPLSARIFAAADVWDALLSERPYRPAWQRENVVQYIREQSGKHFDPRVVQVFLEMIAEEG